MEIQSPSDHDSVPWPHEAGCSLCKADKMCSVCGTSIEDPAGRCTNGRCLKCHAGVCTPGGDQSPGHGFGTREQAILQLARL